MIELQIRHRIGTHHCANCRHFRIEKQHHPADNHTADIECGIGIADLKPHISHLEWVVCANWDAIPDEHAVALYEDLLQEWYNDTL